MTDNVQLVRSLYDALGRGDIEEVLEGLDENVEWNQAEHTPYWPGEPMVGRQAVLAGVFARIGEDYDDFTIDVQRVVGCGETVLVEARYRGTVKQTGALHRSTRRWRTSMTSATARRCGGSSTPTPGSSPRCSASLQRSRAGASEAVERQVLARPVGAKGAECALPASVKGGVVAITGRTTRRGSRVRRSSSASMADTERRRQMMQGTSYINEQGRRIMHASNQPEPSTRGRRPARMIAGLIGGAAACVALVVMAVPASAIVPGPNGRIVFESSRDGNNEIYVMNSDGTVQQNLTNNKQANDVFPAWSPDGTQITFSSDRAEAGDLDIYVMNADGSGVTRLTDAPGEDRGASWTSDGQQIVFHSQRFRDATHSFDLMVMNADGSDERLLFPNASAGYVCGDSETGTVVFNSSGDPLGTNPVNPNGTRDFEIYTVNLDGTDVRQLTNNTVLDSGPKWSPDCSTISYNSLDSGGSLDVHRINADGTNDVNLTNTPGIFDAFSAWSPDGTSIVFSSNRDVNFEIYTMSAVDGSNVQRLTFTDRGEANLRADWGTAPNSYGPPTHKNQCKDGGWREFLTPRTFSDQGDCIDYVQTGV